MTIIISSHILNEIEHIADVVCILANGRVEKEVSMESIRLKYPNGLEDYFFTSTAFAVCRRFIECMEV